jgi:hypothetical protein
MNSTGQTANAGNNSPHAIDREDGTAPLNRGETLVLLLLDPDVRNYTIAALTSLAMIFLILFQQGSDIGGIMIVAMGLIGIFLRWIAAPAFVLITLMYFMAFPFGIPGDGFDNRWEIEDGRFRPVDVMLVMAVLVYTASQFRILGFVHQVVPSEKTAKRNEEQRIRRPPAMIAPLELVMFLGTAFGLVITGQVVWMLLNIIEITPGETFPLKWAETGRSLRRLEPVGSLSPGVTRFILLVGLLAFGTMLGRLIFGYWRLRMMNAAEGAMFLQDSSWLETKRERSRLEKWRIWGRQRARARAQSEQAAAEKAVEQVLKKIEKERANKGKGKP